MKKKIEVESVIVIIHYYIKPHSNHLVVLQNINTIYINTKIK